MGGGSISVPVGLSDARLREELLRMFDESLRPKLKPVVVKCRQFLCNSVFHGKVVVCEHVKKSCEGEVNCEEKKKCNKKGKNGCGGIGIVDHHCDVTTCWEFHLNEHDQTQTNDDDAPSFAGCQGVAGPEEAIRSKAGTVRGVTNRVRAGIATFLNTCGQRKLCHDGNAVVVYVSSLGIIRETFQHCLSVRTILSTLLVNYDERDVFLNRTYQAELMERLEMEFLAVPQVFVNGQHLGDARDIDRLNETGQLRQIMKPYKKVNSFTPCGKCGDYKVLPCSACQGTKKSPRHCNSFTQEFAALRCMQCDERGLVKCDACADIKDA